MNRYFMVSQYTWMLCEGCYLHRLVALAFSKQMNLKFCYIVGWGLPAVLVAIYSALRATQADDRKIVRAVLILIPVFGVHFVLTTFVSPASCTAYLKKLYAEWGIVGLQVHEKKAREKIWFLAKEKTLFSVDDTNNGLPALERK
ncbi:hypothetical protein HPB48_001546 [Haemaphysalis longicornis]|uniref:G-protein coupled receptors family 2 profile 2 domain-containing protein n=1 Tax=Haemaphysalis longicornis TaxID=44386 RepID=A0A9J6FH03_HAELO|nr:hypothetical protein HPB48_001546 [Haemaphysalis longicornis]